MFSIEARIHTRLSGGRHAVIADDDEQERSLLIGHLKQRGFHVSEARDGLEALSLIGTEAPSVAFLRRPVTPTGVEECERAVALASMLYPRTRIVLTASDPLPVAEEGPVLILARPVNLDQLDRCLDGLVA